MYDYVDRPLSALEPGARLLVRAMRDWVAALAARNCPPGAVGPAFDGANVLPALPHFHMAMMLLNKESHNTIAFAPATCTHLAEDEAVLLQIFASLSSTSPSRMRDTLGMVMREEAVAPLFAALTGMVACFAEARLGLGVAARRGLHHD